MTKTKRLLPLLPLLLLAFALAPTLSFAQGAVGPKLAYPFRGGSSGGSSTITNGTTATSGCIAGGVLRSISNLVDCGAGLTYGTGVLSIGTASTLRGGVDLFGATHAFKTRFQVSESQAADVTYTLPINDGSAGHFLKATDGAGTLEWATPAGGGDALTTDPLSQFAATTSLQFAGVISNETGSGLVVLNDTPTFIAPILGTPTSGTLTNATGLPISGITGLGAGVGTWFGTPSSANLATAVTDETGSGALVFGTSPTFTTPILGVAAGTSLDLSANLTTENGVNYCLDAVGTDAYACSLSPAITGYVTGAIYTFKAGAANTGAATLDLNAIGAKTIVKTAGGITTALADNDIRSGSVVSVAYDGTNLQLISPVANAGGGSGTPGGSDTQIQYNNAGSFGGASTMTKGSDGGITIGTGLTGTVVPLTVLRDSSSGNIINFQTTTGNTVAFVNNSGGIGASTLNASTFTLNQGGLFSLDQAGNDLTLSREAAATLQMGQDAGSATVQTIKALDGSGTDIAGSNFIVAGGRGTGTGAGGNRIDQTSPSLATGTTAQTLQDRTVVVAKAKALTASSATNVVLINVASGAFGGGTFEYTVQASDGTDHQARAGSINWAVVNKAGTETCTVSAASELLDGSIIAASAGTLTYAITADTSATNGCYLAINAVSSLTETALNVAYRITANGGTSTLTPQ